MCEREAKLPFRDHVEVYLNPGSFIHRPEPSMRVFLHRGFAEDISFSSNSLLMPESLMQVQLHVTIYISLDSVRASATRPSGMLPLQYSIILIKVLVTVRNLCSSSGVSQMR